jgi:hypothetical protein
VTAAFRWTGVCYDCGRERELETRYDHAAKALCDECAASRPLSGSGPDEVKEREVKERERSSDDPSSSTKVVVPVPVPVPLPTDGERPDLEVLLDDHRRGRAPVEPIPLPNLDWATAATRRVLGDMALCSGLLRAAGDDGTVIYAVDWAARRLSLSSRTVSVALRRLRHRGVIRLVKVLPSMGGGRAGSRVYALALPEEPVGVEVGPERIGRQADEPALHPGDEALVAGAVRAVVDGPVTAPRDRTDEMDGRRGHGGESRTEFPPHPPLGDPSVPCDDPSRCRFRMRLPNGPWTCARNHPVVREPDAEEALIAMLIRGFDATEVRT